MKFLGFVKPVHPVIVSEMFMSLNIWKELLQLSSISGGIFWGKGLFFFVSLITAKQNFGMYNDL